MHQHLHSWLYVAKHIILTCFDRFQTIQQQGCKWLRHGKALLSGDDAGNGIEVVLLPFVFWPCWIVAVVVIAVAAVVPLWIQSLRMVFP
jgi:hypothetical protein